MFCETVSCLRSKLVLIGKNGYRSAQIDARNRNRNEHAGPQFSLDRPLGNEGNPEALLNRILDRIDVIDLQSMSTFGIFLKKPLFG